MVSKNVMIFCIFSNFIQGIQVKHGVTCGSGSTGLRSGYF